MCEWLKKIFGCKCACKHCHCGEENKEASSASAENVTPEQSTPAVEVSPETPVEESKSETENL